MSSLIEINKELQKQSSDIADVKAAILEQLKQDILARKKEDRQSGRREEARREASRASRKVSATPKGFVQGFKEGSGIAGASGLLDGFLKGFFGASTGILAAVLGAVGLAAGKLVKGTLLVGLLTTFGEKAIKALFDKLKDTAFDLKLTKEQEDSFASKTTDGLMAFFLTGLVFKNPLIRLGSALIFAFKDDVLGAIYKLFGVEEVSIGSARDGTTLKYKNIFSEGTIDLPKISKTMEIGIVAVVTGFLLFITKKVTNMVTWLLTGGKSRTEKKFNKILADQEKKFNKQLDDLENRIKMQQDRIERMSRYSRSRTAAGENLENRIKMQLDRIERMSRYSRSRTAAGQNLENQLRMQDRIERMNRYSTSRTSAGQNLENQLRMQDRIERMNRYARSRTAAGQNLENQIIARQQALLSNIMTDSPDGLKQPRAGDMVKLTKGPVVDAEVLKELPDGKLQIKDSTGRIYAIDPDIAKTYTPKSPQTPKGQKFLQFLGLLGRGVGKISPMTFAYTSQQNIATGMYGDIDPNIATGIEALAGPGDLLDLINLPFDKALELFGSDFRFGQDAGGKSREAIMSLLASKYLSKSARKRIFGGKDPLAPTPTVTIPTTEELSAMIPGDDRIILPGRDLGSDLGIGYEADRLPTIQMAIAKQVAAAVMPLVEASAAAAEAAQAAASGGATMPSGGKVFSQMGSTYHARAKRLDKMMDGIAFSSDRTFLD